MSPTKRTKKRQSTLPDPARKPTTTLETPYARASIFTIYLIVTIIIGLGAAGWYQSYLQRMDADFDKLVETELWKVVDIPGKDKGVVAKRNISQGTAILREPALFLVPATIHQSPEDLISSLVSSLSPEGQRAFAGLSHHADPHAIGAAQLLAKAQTNAITAGEGTIGIFPKTARLNHGCSSAFNVAYNWNEDEGVLVVNAFKPIQEGQEILTSYMDTKKPRHERQTYLQSAYNFLCTCAVCSLPPSESKASDERLGEMSKLKTELGKWGTKQIGGEEAIRLIKRIWKLSEEEGYWSERGALALDAVQVAAAHWQEDATRKWGLLAEKWLAIELGANTPQATEAAQAVRKPKSHRSWGSRYRVQVEGPDV